MNVITALLLLCLTGLLSTKKFRKTVKTYKRDRIGRFSKKPYTLITVNDMRQEVGVGRYS